LKSNHKKSPGICDVGAQGGRDGDFGVLGDEGIAVSFSIIYTADFNTVKQFASQVST
jgi:hypothetical protein